MHRFIRTLERRLSELEARFGSIPRPETPGEAAREREVMAAGVEGRQPVPGLAEEERALFEGMRDFAPVLREMIESGIITPNGAPAGAPAPDDLLLDGGGEDDLGDDLLLDGDGDDLGGHGLEDPDDLDPYHP